MTSTVFCIDFDETLSGTDRLRQDIANGVRRIGGEKLEVAYLAAYETVREQHGAVRIPLVLKAVAEQADIDLTTRRQLADMFHTIPYQDYLYPGAEELIAQLKKQGKVIIFSDGDAFFQSQKIYATKAAGLVDAVIILTDKTTHFADLEGYYPADKYVFIDDKQRVLDAAKSYFSERCTTVLVQQGRYVDSSQLSTADLSVGSVDKVADLFH